MARSSASLKIAVTFAPAATPLAPLAGEAAVTVGGVPSNGASGTNDTSTKYCAPLPLVAGNALAPLLNTAFGPSVPVCRSDSGGELIGADWSAPAWEA